MLAIEDLHSELGKLPAGTGTGRCFTEEITIAKFVGIGAQGLAAAEVSIDWLKQAGDLLSLISGLA